MIWELVLAAQKRETTAFAFRFDLNSRLTEPAPQGETGLTSNHSLPRACGENQML